ncbi:MAG: hypothetical protein V8Q82_05930 [Christensenellales bacterium]
MFKTVKRIIDWCGELKGRRYAGFVFSFFSHIFAAMPLMVAAYTVGLLIDAQKGGAALPAITPLSSPVPQAHSSTSSPG